MTDTSPRPSSKKAPMCHAFHNLTHRSRKPPTQGRSVMILPWIAPPVKGKVIQNVV